MLWLSLNARCEEACLSREAGLEVRACIGRQRQNGIPRASRLEQGKHDKMKSGSDLI